MKKERILELDALRGIAALAVVLYHYTTRYFEIFKFSDANYTFKFKYGHFGVQLFFIISGFVIFMTLSNTNSIFEFIYKRASRLYPAYIVCVLMTSFAVYFFGLPGRAIGLKAVIINLTMLQTFIGIPNADGVYWTLTLELVFYFIMCILVVTKLIKRIEFVCLIWLLIACIKNKLELYFNILNSGMLDILMITDYCNLFITGIMFYCIRQKNKLRYHLMIMLCIAYQFILHGVFSGFITIGFISIVYLLIFNKLSFLKSRYFVFFGTISYSLYLVHQNIGYIIIRYLEKAGMTNEVYVVVPVVISICLAAVITFFIEKPVQRFLRSKFSIINDECFKLSNRVRYFLLSRARCKNSFVKSDIE